MTRRLRAAAQQSTVHNNQNIFFFCKALPTFNTTTTTTATTHERPHHRMSSEHGRVSARRPMQTPAHRTPTHAKNQTKPKTFRFSFGPDRHRLQPFTAEAATKRQGNTYNPGFSGQKMSQAPATRGRTTNGKKKGRARECCFHRRTFSSLARFRPALAVSRPAAKARAYTHIHPDRGKAHLHVQTRGNLCRI